MIPGMMCVPGGSSWPPVVTYLAQTTDTADLTTYTFSGQSLGTEASDRRIVVGVKAVSIFNRNINSVTVGGVTASFVVGDDTALLDPYGLYVADVPAGTTGDIVVTFSAGMSSCAIATWSLTGISSTTAAATAGGVGTSANLNVQDKDVVIVWAYKNTTATMVPTGYTERFDNAVEASYRVEGGDYTASATETPRSISAATSTVINSAAWR